MKKLFVIAATSATLLLSSVSFAQTGDDSSNRVGNLESDVYSLEQKLSEEGISYSQVPEVKGTGFFLEERGLEQRYSELKSLLNESRES